jgi:Fic family protein
MMEPMFIPEGDSDLHDLVFELIQKAASLTGQLSPPVQQEIGRLVRSMNCYYSNFIEGHQTNPRDIEQALANKMSGDEKRRDLQEEARAHIEVQGRIDSDTDDKAWPASEKYVQWLHREFCTRLPPSMLRVKAKDSGREVDVMPGEYRKDFVDVGRHIPPSPNEVPFFMHRFEQAYEPSRLSKIQRLLSVATAHHRLLWIHPFVDGNGRVARLMSHALLLKLGIGSSLWSVSRGLARSVDEYKVMLTVADNPRRNDTDGRGALSLEGLKEFSKFFLKICIDQIDFMAYLLKPSEILRRIEIYVKDEVSAKRLPKGSFEMLREAYYQGEVPRGRAPEITGYEERRARETVSVLVEKGLLLSKNHRAPLALGFPIDVLERWLPTLYPGDARNVP